MARAKKKASPKTAWKKGQSGNPKGRPRENPEIREALKLALPAALAALLGIIQRKKAADRDRVAAAKTIFEFGLAKPAPEIGNSNLEKLEAIARALRGDDGDDT